MCLHRITAWLNVEVFLGKRSGAERRLAEIGLAEQGGLDLFWLNQVWLISGCPPGPVRALKCDCDVLGCKLKFPKESHEVYDLPAPAQTCLVSNRNQ